MHRAHMPLCGLLIFSGIAAAPITLDAAEAPTDAERSSAARCATFSVRSLVGDDAWSEPARSTRDGILPCDHTPVGPPPNPGIGDSWDWYIWRLNGPPAADLRSCTIRGMGDHCYVVVEDSQWNVNIDQAQVDTIVSHFEQQSIGPFPDQGIWEINTTHFGDPPDALDQDPRVYIMYYDFDVSSDGFFWAFDQQCDDVAQYHSNECDVVYMNCSDFDPAGSYLLAVLGHEFEHLIHYNQDPNESAWVDEGVAELAMWLYGDPDPVSSFAANPDNQLTDFGGSFPDYIKAYLWNLYFYERYGGQPAIFDLVHEPMNSTFGYDAVLDRFGYSEDFVDAFADWVVANYLDDTTIGDGRFGYLGEDLPPFNAFATFSNYPVGPNASSVEHWAADYARYLTASDLFLTFDGSDNNLYSVRALLLDDVSPTEVIDMPLDAGRAGALSLPQIGTTHTEAVAVYASTQSFGTVTYVYGAEADVIEIPETVDPTVPSLVARPEAGGVTFGITIPESSAGETLRLDVFDAGGRLVDRVLDTIAHAGTREFRWDGRATHGGRPVSGHFFARLNVGEIHQVARVVVVR